MTKSLASIPVEKREAVILRRIRNGGGGNGYLAAVDAAQKLGLSTGPKANYVSKKKWDKGQKKAGGEFAKAMAGRAKNHQLRRKPSIKNTPRIKRG